MELGGTEPLVEHDQIVTGNAGLGGTLQLSLIDGFVPAPGQQFVVLTASAGATGRFATLIQPTGLPPGQVFEAVYGPGSVTPARDRLLRQLRRLDDDAVLNVNDFICFQSRFAAADPYADCDQNSAFNVNDFVCFQSRFAAGCP